MEYTEEHIAELRDRWVHPSKYGVKIPEGMTEEKFAEVIKARIFGAVSWTAEIEDRHRKLRKLREIQELQKAINFPFIEEVTGRDRVDLRGINLAYYQLIKVYLYGVDLSFADLSCTNLQKACLLDANLQGTSLLNAILEGTDLVDVNLERTDLSSAKLQKANLIGTRFNGATMNSATKFIDPENGIKKIKTEKDADNKNAIAEIYRDFLRNTEIRQPEIEKLKLTLKDARKRHYTAAYEIYLKLKLLYRANGFYKEADNFYFRELRCRQKALWVQYGFWSIFKKPLDMLAPYILKPLVALGMGIAIIFLLSILSLFVPDFVAGILKAVGASIGAGIFVVSLARRMMSA